jgi:hypothetical protein
MYTEMPVVTTSIYEVDSAGGRGMSNDTDLSVTISHERCASKFLTEHRRLNAAHRRSPSAKPARSRIDRDLSERLRYRRPADADMHEIRRISDAELRSKATTSANSASKAHRDVDSSRNTTISSDGKVESQTIEKDEKDTRHPPSNLSPPISSQDGGE